ncbi:HD-GYP domain-containing protein [Paraglaciecola aestuariivivens]
MLQLIDIDAIQPGMYVVKVTKQTGQFTLKQAGKVKRPQDIQLLATKGILQVQVDLSKSDHLQENQQQDNPPPIYVNEAGYSYNQQLDLSLKLRDQVKSVQGKLIQRVANGKIHNLDEISQITDELVTLAFDCNDAIFISTMLKDSDQYLIEHGVNCALLLVIFGRALGLPKSELKQLGMGGLLMDIGMSKLPLLMLLKPDTLSEQERARMQRHVDMALSLLESMEGVSDITRTVVEQHHERIDGSGYPKGLQATDISIYGKMAAIVDCYDSLTTLRPYRDALKPDIALKQLSKEELGLDKTLLAKFIQCIGANPVGSLVKLASGKLAMVMRLNPSQPLYPVVMVFYNLTTQLDEVAQIDLSKEHDEIVGTVAPEDYGIGLASFLTQAAFKS